MTDSRLTDFKRRSLKLADACPRPNLFPDSLTFSTNFSGGALNWRGRVNESGVFSLYFWNCNLSRAEFSLRAVLTNPSSRLDTRDMILPTLYRVFVAIYCIITLVWIYDVSRGGHRRASALLHFLPITRAISLFVSESFWVDAERSDFAVEWKVSAIKILEFCFYTMTLATISFACAGICIYRQKFFWRDRIEIVISAAIVVGAALGTQFVVDIKQAFVLLGFICLSCFWYLKQSIISLVTMTELMKHMGSDPLVIAKVSLSRNFVVFSFLTVLLALLIPSIAIGNGIRRSVCATILEAGLYVNAALHGWYFVRRKRLWGEELREFLQRRPAVIVEPTGSAQVLLRQTSDVV